MTDAAVAGKRVSFSFRFPEFIRRRGVAIKEAPRAALQMDCTFKISWQLYTLCVVGGLLLREYDARTVLSMVPLSFAVGMSEDNVIYEAAAQGLLEGMASENIDGVAISQVGGTGVRGTLALWGACSDPRFLSAARSTCSPTYRKL